MAYWSIFKIFNNEMNNPGVLSWRLRMFYLSFLALERKGNPL